MYSFIVCLYSNIRYALLPTIRKFSKTCIKKCLSKVNNVSSIKLDAIIFSLFLSLGNDKVLAIPNFPNLFISRCKIAIKTQWKVLQLKCLLVKVAFALAYSSTATYKMKLVVYTKNIPQFLPHFLFVFLLFSRKRIGLSPLVGTCPLPHSVATYGLPGGYAHYGAVLPAWDIPCVRANTKGFDLNLQIGKKDYWSVESQSGQL